MEIANFENIKISDINCFQHKKNKIVGICIDKKCQNKSKYMCLDCMFEIHSGHYGIKINEFEEKYKEKYNSYIEEVKIINQIYKKSENKLKDKFEKFKKEINNDLDSFFDMCIDNLKIKSKSNDKYNKIKGVRQNYPPINNEQMDKLIENLTLLIDDNSFNDNNNNISEEFLEKYENKINKKFDSLKKTINHYIKNIFKGKFEWSTKTYDDYDFYYKLEEDNQKATKISKGPTMTVCRTKEPLEDGIIYKLDYFIHYESGEIDVGFGDDEIGSKCWLRCSNGYSASTNGLYVDGIKNNADISIKNCKKVTLIIDMEKYQCEVNLDDKIVANFNIKKNFTYYPMIAIRGLNNSVKIEGSII